MKNINGALTMLLSSCLLSMSPVLHAEINPPDETSAGLAKLAEPRYRALEAELRNDVKLADNVAKYKIEAKAVMLDRRLKETERRKKLELLSKNFEPTLKDLFRRAKIDEAAYVAEGDRHLRRMAARKNKNCSSQYLGYLGWYWKCLPKRGLTPAPADKEITLSAPFPFEQKALNGAGEATVDKQAGTYYTEARVFMAGGHDNSAGLAHFFEVDANYRRIEASLALPETNWYVSAFADVFGVFGSSARSKVEIFNNNQIVCAQEVEHASMLAPVLYFAHRSGSDNVVVDCEIDAPVRGDEIVLRATSIVGAWGGVVGMASAYVDAKPRDLRLLLKF